MIKAATISLCEKYRYSLVRHWAKVGETRRTALFVMLNPSTADADNDDPTIRRCISFAKKLDCNVLTVVNLYAFRTKSPKILYRNAEEGIDIFGPSNKANLALESSRADHVVCAWGAGAKDKKVVDRVWDILQENQGSWSSLSCLGETKMGHPRHPLYVKGDQEFIEF